MEWLNYPLNQRAASASGGFAPRKPFSPKRTKPHAHRGRTPPLSYADEIFSIGRELMNALKHRPGTRPLRVNVGLTDSFPKLIAFEILKAAFRQGNAIHLICREGELAALVH
jgi:LysR family transcriptional regulator, transcriptional activator of nhaA